MSPSTAFPEPLVIPPLLPHKQTFILLHHRGANAERFGPALLSAHIRAPFPSSGAASCGADSLTLRAVLPHARFVFPTAPPSRATIYRRCIINQWFDGWHLEDGALRREELQADGLRYTVGFLHELIRREIQLVGGNARDVVLGGLSQGCAAILVASLLWEGEPLGAVVGMCGWMPYLGHMDEEPSSGNKMSDEADDGFDPFERSSSSSASGTSSAAEDIEPADLGLRAVKRLSEELELKRPPYESIPLRQTPVFLGHGRQDDRVPISLARETAAFLENTGVTVSLKTYQDLGHWYSADMLHDIAIFVQKTTGWA
ncbi:Alpha/beta-hydrolase [Pleurostoma richardsiae]|uniref:Alpha/beta-hydrolase n=1 Tax=Pleurostoma richardsiae TaxID=41990 RepID=A0AA38VC17_9PEZI|nr:Alpha/beta-hydrolase [Pleurostoma richardsiae]